MPFRKKKHSEVEFKKNLSSSTNVSATSTVFIFWILDFYCSVMLGCTMPYIPLCTSKLVRCNLSSTLQKEQHGHLMTAGRRLGVKLPLACSTPYVPTSTYNRWLRANSTYSWKHIESQGVPFLFLFKNLERKRQQVDDYYQQRLAKTNNAITDCFGCIWFF